MSTQKENKMIIIRNYGLESEAVRDISASYTIPVAKLFKVKEDEVVFLTERGYLIQNGEDQTDYFSYVEVLYPSNIKIDKEAVNDVLKEIYSKFTFHTIIRFIPFKEEDSFFNLNEDYPQYMTPENTVHIEHEHEDEDEDEEEEEYPDLYEGDIFEHLEEDLNK